MNGNQRALKLSLRYKNQTLPQLERVGNRIFMNVAEREQFRFVNYN